VHTKVLTNGEYMHFEIVFDNSVELEALSALELVKLVNVFDTYICKSDGIRVVVYQREDGKYVTHRVDIGCPLRNYRMFKGDDDTCYLLKPVVYREIVDLLFCNERDDPWYMDRTSGVTQVIWKPVIHCADEYVSTLLMQQVLITWSEMIGGAPEGIDSVIQDLQEKLGVMDRRLIVAAA